MGEMADYLLEELSYEDEAQFECLGASNVFQVVTPPPAKCPGCGRRYVLKIGRFGPFYGCENFPRCSCRKTYNAGPHILSEEDLTLMDEF